eukprot:SAG31_NODE_603_length_13622_cov_19.019953_2_plen_117_part_00
MGVFFYQLRCVPVGDRESEPDGRTKWAAHSGGRGWSGALPFIDLFTNLSIDRSIYLSADCSNLGHQPLPMLSDTSGFHGLQFGAAQVVCKSLLSGMPEVRAVTFSFLCNYSRNTEL